MARFIGIDIGTTQVKVAVVRGGGRKFQIEKLVSFDRTELPVVDYHSDDPAHHQPAPTRSLSDLLKEAARAVSIGSDPLSVGFEGEATYVRVLELPATVRRRIVEVLPFELEAQLPFDIDDAVFDQRELPEIPSGPAARSKVASPLAPVRVLVAAARTSDVRARIDMIRDAFGREPDHVVPGGFSMLGMVLLNTPLKGGKRAVLDLGHDQSELTVIDPVKGEIVFSRTISRGVEGMPSSAEALVSEIRRTLAALRAQGVEAPDGIYLTGGGAVIPGLANWLTNELGLTVMNLPSVGIEALDKNREASRYSRAIGVALSAVARFRSLDLRRGPLAFERGFGFLRDRLPLLTGLAAAILVSFLFATWAKARLLAQDREVLEATLAQTSQDVFGVKVTEVEAAEALVRGKGPALEDDPLPRADAFDVLVQLSELIPTNKMKHDVEKLEVQRLSQGGYKVTILGIAPTAEDVQTVESVLKGFRCFNNPTVIKKAKAISDDRQKYTLEIEMRCPEEGGATKKPGAAPPAPSAPQGAK